MDVEEYRDYCMNKNGATEGFPFDETTLVFKVGGKIFAFIDIYDRAINLKCDPAKAVSLREQYSSVQPGYHMNKTHWNTVHLDLVSDQLICEWTDHSYDLVFARLPDKIKAGLLKKHKSFNKMY